MAATSAIPILTLLGGMTGCVMGADIGCAARGSMETVVPEVFSGAAGCVAGCVVGGVGGAASGAMTGATLDAFSDKLREW